MQIQVGNLSREAGGAHDGATTALARGVRRATALVSQLLHLARLEESGGALDEMVDVNTLVLESVADHAALADHKQIDLEVNFACQAVCRGAPDEVRALLSSLIDNAVRYTPSCGRIDVSIGRGDGRFVVEVLNIGAYSPGAPRRDSSIASFAPLRRGRKGRVWDCRSRVGSLNGMVSASRSKIARTA